MPADLPPKIRTFIAIFVRPMPDVLEVLGQLRQMGQALRPVPPDNLHLTLRYLGPLPKPRHEPIFAAMRAAAKRSSFIDLTLRDLGAFPNFNRPNVIWAGVDDPEGALASFVEDMSGELAEVGFAPEKRPFHPHVTLARVKRRPPRRLADVYQRFAEHTFGDWKVKEVHLMSSELTPNGPKYEVVKSVRLG